MTNIRKVKRRKKFRVNVNRKRLRNKLRKLPAIGCEEIKQAWEVKKSTRSNLGEMGLAYNPNEILKIPNTKRELIKSVKDKFRDTENDEEDDEEIKKGPPAKIHVAEKLESEAKAPRVCLFKLPKNEVQFATYMMDKYGDNYKAMVRDRKNYYQLTWRQIRSKINRFKGIPEQYAEYLLKKGEIVLDDPEPLEETRRKIALENIQKHCIPKKPKQKAKESVWEVESINGEDIDHNIEENPEEIPCENNEETKNVIVDGTQNDSQKKLKLFSDNESDDENESGLNNKKLKSGIIVDKSITHKREAKGGFNTDKVQNKKSKNNKQTEALKKMCSSDSDTEEEFEGDDDETGFVDLSDMTEEGLSDDDILDDGEFITDSNEESD